MVLKGQIGLDVSLASLILLLIIFSFTANILLVIKTAGESFRDFTIQKKLFEASEALVATTGFPRDWTAANYERLGLAEFNQNAVKHHQLSLKKIEALGALDLAEIKNNLLLGDYDVAISIETLDGEKLLEKGVAGGTAVNRLALCGGDPCVLRIRAA